MTSDNPKIREFAVRLIALETADSASQSQGAPLSLACEKLRPSLATLLGSAGFRALLLRSLSLASAEIPWLRMVRVAENGTLGGLDKLSAQLDPAEITQGGVLVISRLLGLLEEFIGDNLTVALVRGVWPKLPADDFCDQNGHTK